MTPRFPRTGTAAAVALAVLLTGCGGDKKKDGDASGKELAGNASGDQTDPALTSALEDQIMVDPALAQQRNGAAARPGPAPAQSPIPSTAPGGGNGSSGQTIGELAQTQAAGKAATNAACYRNLQYSVAWAQRLPAELPLFTDAQVSEAAGNATAPCNVRVVSFVSGAAIDRLVEFYEASSKRAGFATERQGAGAERVVAGDKGADAFYATFRSRKGGGTEVDLLANHGR
jgi:hypothetical protein